MSWEEVAVGPFGHRVHILRAVSRDKEGRIGSDLLIEGPLLLLHRLPFSAPD